MKRRLLCILLAGLFHSSLFTLHPCLAAAPVNVTVSQEVINVTIDDGNGQVATITVPDTEVVNIITAGEQGIPGSKGDKGDPGIAGPAGPTGPQGPAGADGIQGPAGMQGPAGPAGADGPPGVDGPAGPPGPTGATGTRGYDGREVELQKSATHVQWRYIADPPGVWNNLVALADLAGTDGTNGTDGRTILNGAGVPSDSLGANGDFYLDTTFVHLYGPKAGGAWPGIYIELVGPQGEPGPPGPAGNVDSAGVRGALDDPIDGAVVWVQQGPTEAATEPKTGVKDRLGNVKQWTDGNGTIIRQCIAADSAPAFKMLSSSGAVLYSVACDNTMEFSGTVTIK